jgi:hypothetical protein
MAQMTDSELAGLIARTREQAFDDAVVAVQAQLHRLSDDVGRLRAREVTGIAPRPAVKRAGDIAHALAWGLGLCDVGLLVTLAAEADAAQAALAATATEVA